MIQEITAFEYDELVMKSDGPVIVDFYSTQCPPCEAVAPKFHFFSDLYGDEIKFYKIFRQGNKDLSSALAVKSSPTLLFYQDGKEIAPRLNGAIKKSAIKETILGAYGLEDRTSGTRREVLEYDVAIVGAGPAGLSASIYTSIAKLRTVVLDKGPAGGTVNLTHLIKNYPGTGEDVAGAMLMHKMSEQAKALNADIMTAIDINEIDLVNKSISVDDDKLIKAGAIIIATGSKPRPLGIPGEAEFFGKGISYCATCDGAFYEGKDIFVIGGGNSSLQEAMYLTRFVNKLTIVHQFDEFQANKTLVDEVVNNPKITVLYSHEPTAFLGKDSFEQLELVDLKTKERKLFATEGVFVFVGYIPQTELVRDSLTFDKYGYIVADENMATSIAGVYVAGDVRPKRYRQITTAVSDGTIAALSIVEYLKERK